MFRFLIILIGLCTMPLFSQINESVNVKPYDGKNLVIIKENNIRCGEVVEGMLDKPNLPADTIYEQKDTFDLYLKRSNGIKLYTATIDNVGMPMTGYNPFYHHLGTKCKINESKQLKYILFAFNSKTNQGTTREKFPVMIMQGNLESGLPEGTPLATTFLHSDSVKASKTTDTVTFTLLRLSTPVTVNGNFTISIQTYNNLTEYDYMTLYTNTQGDGKKENSAFVIVNNNTTQTSINLSEFWDNKGLKLDDGNPPDVDLMIIPVFSQGWVGVEDQSPANNLTAKGLCLKSITPNPASGPVIFDVVVEHSTNLSINIIDNNGKLVQSISKSNLSPNEYKFELDMSNLSSGSYFYTIVTDYTKFGGVVNIIK